MLLWPVAMALPTHVMEIMYNVSFTAVQCMQGMVLSVPLVTSLWQICITARQLVMQL